MKSLVVVEKRFVVGEEDLGTYVVFDVVDGIVEEALYVGEGEVMESLTKVVIEYGDTLYGDVLNTRYLNKSYSVLNDRIAELKEKLVNEGVAFEEVEAMESAELLEDGIAWVDGVYHVILTDVGFGKAKFDFNPRGLGYIDVVDEVDKRSMDVGVRYKVVYTGTEASSVNVYYVLLCVGKRIELELSDAKDRQEFARVVGSLKQELSDLTGVSLETIEAKLEAVTI